MVVEVLERRSRPASHAFTFPVSWGFSALYPGFITDRVLSKRWKKDSLDVVKSVPNNVLFSETPPPPSFFFALSFLFEIFPPTR